MSMHKKPLTKLEHDGLLAHGLDIGTPSQISDVFRQGIAYALANAPTVQREVPESIKELIRNQQPLPADMQKILYDNLFDLYESPEPLPVIPLTHEQLNTPFGAGRTVQHREGWVSVPIEPTELMLELGRQATIHNEKTDKSRVESCRVIYKAMIQAAPTDTE